jgi:hypothetical protein
VSDASRSRCCNDFRWVEDVSFGRVAGHDLSLGRCGGCGMPVMTVVEPGSGSTSRVSLTRTEARLFRGLRDDTEGLRHALQAWVT